LYQNRLGSSLATPFITGALALVMQAKGKQLTAAESLEELKLWLRKPENGDANAKVDLQVVRSWLSPKTYQHSLTLSQKSHQQNLNKQLSMVYIAIVGAFGGILVIFLIMYCVYRRRYRCGKVIHLPPATFEQVTLSSFKDNINGFDDGNTASWHSKPEPVVTPSSPRFSPARRTTWYSLSYLLDDDIPVSSKCDQNRLSFSPYSPSSVVSPRR
jgi:hypothetical protein